MKGEYEIRQDKIDEVYFMDAGDKLCDLHFHQKIEILYILCGVKKIRIGSELYTLPVHTLSVCDSYQAHSYLKSEGSEQLTVIIPLSASAAYASFMTDKRLKSNILTDSAKARALLPYILKLKDASLLNPVAYSGTVNYLLGEIIDGVGTEKADIQKDLSLMKEILMYLQYNFADDITLNSLADKFGYSKYYFSRLFNSYFKTGLNDYLSMLRVLNAQKLLSSKKIKVIDAAYSSGFNSVQTFYRAYKNYFNAAPNEKTS